MTLCCDVLCQHPACWKAEIDFKRNSLREDIGEKKRNYLNHACYKSNNFFKYDARSEAIVATDGSLPTYKTLDLGKSGFPQRSELRAENESKLHLPKEPENQKGCKKSKALTYPFVPPVNQSLSNYIKKICDRRKEVELQESAPSKPLPSEKVFFKTLSIENVKSFGDEYTKIYTWVPGKNPRSKTADRDASEEKILAMKMIDGANLPSVIDEKKYRQKLRSTPTAHSYRRKNIPYHIQSLFAGEDPDDYIELLQYLNLTREKCDKINNHNVPVPSPLKSKRVKLYENCNENKTPRYGIRLPEPQPRNLEESETVPDQKTPTRHDTLYIKNGVMLPRSPTLLKSLEPRKLRKREPLPLSRVSVPKKVVRKLPLYDHCSSSIKKTNLPEVTMQPLTSSENTSIMTSEKSSRNASLLGDLELLQRNAVSSPDMVRVPASSPLSMADAPSSSDTERIINHMDVETSDENLHGNEGENVLTEEGGRYLHFEDDELPGEPNGFGVREAPSAITISKASKTDTRVKRKDRAVTLPSPTLSSTSKASDGWLLDKDIITRTYDKYKSFSPFKTPHCSAHGMRRESSAKPKRSGTRIASSLRQILPPSLHNLDQFLPDSNEAVKTQSMYITRSLSPSRSMFIRQQRQPAIEKVPSEIMVSRFPILPAITKSQGSMRGESVLRARTAPDPGSSDVHIYGTTNLVEPCTFADDGGDEDEGEEILLSKQAFSAFDLIVEKETTGDSDEEIASNALSVRNRRPSISVSDLSSIKTNLRVAIDVHKRRNSLIVTTADRLTCNFLLSPVNANGSNLAIQPTTTEQHSHSLENIPSSSEEIYNNSENEERTSTSPPGDTNETFSDEIIVVEYENTYTREEKGNYEQREDSISLDVEEEIVISTPENAFKENDLPIPAEYNPTPISFFEIDAQDNDSSITEIETVSRESISNDDVQLESACSITIEAYQEIDEETFTEQSLSVGSISSHQTDSVSLRNVKSSTIDTASLMGSINTINENDILHTLDMLNPIKADVTNINNEVEQDIKTIEKVNHVKPDSPSTTVTRYSTHTTSGVRKTPSSLISKISTLSPNKQTGRLPQPSGHSMLNLIQSKSRDLYSGSVNQLDDPQPSIMKDIFTGRLSQQSSLFCTPAAADDFAEGLDLDLELEEEIVRAMIGLEEFVLDNYEEEENDD